MSEKNVLIVGGECAGMRVVVEERRNVIVFKVPQALDLNTYRNVDAMDSVVLKNTEVTYELYDIDIVVSANQYIPLSIGVVEGECIEDAINSIIDAYTEQSQNEAKGRNQNDG